MTENQQQTVEILQKEIDDLKNNHENTCQELQKALREAEYNHELCQKFADASTDIQLRFDSRFKIADINEAGIKFIKPDAKKEDFIGHNLEKIAPNAKKRGQYNEFLNVLATGKEFVFEDDFLASTHHKDPVKLRVKAFRVGSHLGIVASNITEFKQVEAGLATAKQNFHALTDLSSDAVVIAQDGKLQFANQTFRILFGFTQKDIEKGLSLFNLIADKDRDTFSAQYSAGVRENGTSASFRTDIITKDGRIIPCETSSTSISYNGRDGFLTVIRDISELVRAEETQKSLETQLQQAQKLESLGVLTGGIAHDFNNLLTGILGNTDLALLELSDPLSARKYLEGIEKAARQAANLTQQMLAYTGKGHFVIKSVDVSKLIANTERLLKTSVSKNVSLILELADNLPPVEADASQIQQLLMNLITNSSESFGYEKGGRIRVTTGLKRCNRAFLNRCHGDEDLEEGPYVFVEIADNGGGMDAKTMTRIFDPFFSTKFTGRGLGLSAVLGIIRGHKGALWVASEAGKGSTFQAFFPSMTIQKEDAFAKTESVQEDQWKGSGTILLIDDEETVRMTGSLMLERMGFEVLTAMDGLEGLKFFKESADVITCVLLDLTMPRMDGRKTLKELRKIRADIPVILSSGYDEQDVIQRFTGRGLAGFIQKPYKYKNLQEILKETLDAPVA